MIISTVKKASAVILLFSAFVCSAAAEHSIRVCWYPIQNFQETDCEGNHSGYMYEYLQCLAGYLDMSFTFVDAPQAQALSMLDQGRTDIVCGLPDSDAAMARCDLVKPSAGQTYYVIVSRRDDPRFIYNDFSAVQGMTVALYDGFYTREVIAQEEKKHGVTARILSYTTPEAALSALVHGDADLALVNSFIPTSDYSVVALCGAHNLFIGTKKGNEELRSKLDNAVQRINIEIPDYAEALQSRYTVSVAQGKLSFTKAEQGYIATAPAIDVYLRTDLPVYSFRDRTGLHGFIPGLFDRISELSGLRFVYVPLDTNQQAVEAAGDNAVSIDGYTAGNYRWAERNNLRLTIPVTDYPLVFIYRKNLDHSIYKVGYLANNFLPDSVTESENYEMIPYPTRRAAMNDALNGTIDAYVVNMYTAQQLLAEHKYHSMIMSNAENVKASLSFAVPHNSRRELVSILNKSISSLSTTEKNALLQKGLSDFNHYSLVDFLRRNLIVVLLIAALFVLLIFIIILQKRNETKLAEVSRSKDAFLANMSHDFRTPLTAIKGLAYLGDTEKNEKYYKQIISSSDYLLELVKDVLNIQRYARGEQLELFPGGVKTKDIQQGVLLVVRGRAKEKKITISSDFQCLYPYLYTDTVRLKQVLINILNNAVKYSPPGSTVFWSSTQTIKNGNVSFVSTVKDAGVGMSRDFIENRLFHAFEREHNQYSITEGGTGLGLAITKMIVDRMGGTIAVVSEPGKGSVFTVSIPVEVISQERYESLVQTDRRGNVAYDFTGKHILVCEDNELNTFIIKTILEKRGCVVDTAPDGESGIRLFSASAVDFYTAVLMDIRMPGIGGLEATRRIRSLQRPDASSVVIVALSANAFDEDKAQSIAAGMNAHVPKPVDVDLLFNTLAKLLTVC